MPVKELEEGDMAPDFSLPSSEGRTISLKEFRGKKTVLLYFYPKDDTPGCTREACAFRDDLAKFKKYGAVILGVSADGLESHKKFIDKFSLPFSLLSDGDNAVAMAYGVYGKKNLYGREFMGIVRSTFVIDEAGKLAKIYRNVKVDGHSEALLEKLAGGSK